MREGVTDVFTVLTVVSTDQSLPNCVLSTRVLRVASIPETRFLKGRRLRERAPHKQPRSDGNGNGNGNRNRALTPSSAVCLFHTTRRHFTASATAHSKEAPRAGESVKEPGPSHAAGENANPKP